jgi:hypothetical protein
MEAPALTLLGPAVDSLLSICGLSYQVLGDPCTQQVYQYSDPGCAAIDLVDGNLSCGTSGVVDVTTTGTYILSYRVVDSAGNYNVTNRTVRVVGAGCTNSSMFNFDASATVDDGSCVPYKFGCTNASAINFNAAANSDHCMYGISCTGVTVTAIANPNVYPVRQLTLHNESDWCACAGGFSGSHCTDNIDDCASDPCVGGTCHDGDHVFWCSDCPAGKYGPRCALDICTNDSIGCINGAKCVVAQTGQAKCACDAGALYNSVSQLCEDIDECASSPCWNGGTCRDGVLSFRCSCRPGYWGMRCGLDVHCGGSCAHPVRGCMNPQMFTYDPSANLEVAADCVPVVHGCTDSSASNWRHNANTDDGSCVAFVYGCMDSAAFNHDPTANSNKGVACIDVVRGCLNSTMLNFDAAANVANYTCSDTRYSSRVSCEVAGQRWIDGCVPIVAGCQNDTAINFNSAANRDDGSCIILGCTNPDAVNFDTYATRDSGLCIVVGCTNSRAVNYVSAATIDNGQCVVLGCTNPMSFNFDFHASADDGSCREARSGCLNFTSPNYDAVANVPSGHCVGHCMNDLQWVDSDGDGCSAYYLGYW